MFATLFIYAAWLQEASTAWDLRSMWTSMGLLAKIVVVILFILFVLVIIVGRLLRRQAHDRDKARIDWPRGNILRHTRDHHVGVSLDFLGRYRARNQISESVASTCAA